MFEKADISWTKLGFQNSPDFVIFPWTGVWIYADKNVVMNLI